MVSICVNYGRSGRGARRAWRTMSNVTRAEHERVIKEMILIRNKYTSLLKTAIKHTAERDKFEELLHKARAETNRVRCPVWRVGSTFS